MAKERIAGHQLWFIIFLMRSTIIVSFLPVLTSADALQDAWISAILALIGSVLFVYFFNLLDQRFPHTTIVEYSQKLLGRWGSKLLSIILLGFFLLFAFSEIRLYGELIKTGFLVHTPLYVTIILMLIVSTICAYLGVEVLARTADFLGIIFIILLFLLIVIPLKAFDFKNIQPIMARGMGPVIRGTLLPISLINQMWIIGILNADTNKSKYKFWIPISAVGASITFLVLVVFLIIGVIGAYQGANSVFPLLTMLRSVQISEFLQRTESVVVFGWGLSLFTTVTAYIYAISKILSQLFNLKSYQFMTIPTGLTVSILSLVVFDDLFSISSFFSIETFAKYGLYFLVITLTLLWIGYGFYKFRNGENKE